MTGAPLDWSGARLDGTQWQGIQFLSIEFAPDTPFPATLPGRNAQR